MHYFQTNASIVRKQIEQSKHSIFYYKWNSIFPSIIKYFQMSNKKLFLGLMIICLASSAFAATDDGSVYMQPRASSHTPEQQYSLRSAHVRPHVDKTIAENQHKSNQNIIFGSDNYLRKSNYNEIAGNYNALDRSNGNVVVGGGNTLYRSNRNAIGGCANTLSKSHDNFVGGDYNTLDHSNYNTIQGSANGLYRSNGNQVTGDRNFLANSDGNQIQGCDNVLNC